MISSAAKYVSIFLGVPCRGMLETAGIILILGFLGLLGYLLSIQKQREFERKRAYTPPTSNQPKAEPLSFVPMLDTVVPSHASYTNKFNDIIGNQDSQWVSPENVAEVAVASDWFHWPYLPTEFHGPYWPSGSIAPDYIYPGGRRRMRSLDNNTFEVAYLGSREENLRSS
jgi:hypothetical protein